MNTIKRKKIIDNMSNNENINKSYGKSHIVNEHVEKYIRSLVKENDE